MVKEQRRQHGDALSGGDRDHDAAPHEDGTEGAQPAQRQPPYEKWTRETLYAHARSRRIAGRSSMSKQQLIDALRRT